MIFVVHIPAMQKKYTLLRTGVVSIAILSQCCLISQEVAINKVYQQSIAQPSNIPHTATVLDPNGNLFLVGNTLGANGDRDVLITKSDRDGVLLWQETYNGTANGNDYGVACLLDNNGNIYVVATTVNMGTDHDFTIIKYDATGDFQWDLIWDGPEGLADIPASIAAHGNDLYVCGVTWADAISTDYALIKFNDSGVLEWEATYDYTSFIDIATKVLVDTNGDPMVTGASANSMTSWDHATVLFDQWSGSIIDEIRVPVPGIGLDQVRAACMDAVAIPISQVTGRKMDSRMYM
jgi:hypothetical protein